MKTYEAKMWRSNPQSKNGGYETTRTTEAKTLAAAEKKFEKICANTIYGGMSVIEIKEKGAE